MATSPSNGVWKWIATTGAAFTAVVFAMGGGWLYESSNRPSKAEVEIIRERQLDVLTRLAVLEEQVRLLREELAMHQAETK